MTHPLCTNQRRGWLANHHCTDHPWHDRRPAHRIHQVSIVRAPRPDRGFTIIDNQVIRDSRLSYRARGILAWILSQPDDWRTDYKSIAREGKEGESAVRTALKELRDAGYIQQIRRQADRGRWETINLVYDQPQTASPQVAPSVGKPSFGGPKSGEPTPVRSTNTKNYDEDDLSCVDAAHRATMEARPRSNWSSDDLALWCSTIGAKTITSDGSGPWSTGTWTAEAFYRAFRQGATSLTAKKWPGRYLDTMYDWEDYLSGLGLTVNE